MKANRSIMVLIAVAVGIAISAFFLRGERPAPPNPDLPSVVVETQ